MGQPIDRIGDFRGSIIDYGLKEVDSGAVAVSLVVSITEMWDPANKEWGAWDEYQQEATGDVWIIKKDGGGVNENGSQSLVRNAGWNGDLLSIINKTWEPCRIAFSVVRDVYKDVARFKIGFINDFNRAPGAAGNVTPDKAKELATRFGAQLRAIAGNAKRNAPATNGTPPKPPPPSNLTPTPTPASVGSDPNDIPF
jgi:hypothetical protein